MCPRKNCTTRQCTVELSGPNASYPICVCLIMNISATELPNFIRKYYSLQELLIFKYWRQNISVSNIVLQQDNTPAHRASETVHLLTHETPDFITPALWPANSPDLNPVDYQIWGKLQERVYCSQIRDVDQLKLRLIRVWTVNISTRWSSMKIRYRPTRCLFLIWLIVDKLPRLVSSQPW